MAKSVVLGGADGGISGMGGGISGMGGGGGDGGGGIYSSCGTAGNLRHLAIVM